MEKQSIIEKVDELVNDVLEKEVMTFRSIIFNCLFHILRLIVFCIIFILYVNENYISRIIFISIAILVLNGRQLQIYSRTYVYNEVAFNNLIKFFNYIGIILLLFEGCYDYLFLNIGLKGICIYILTATIMFFLYKFIYKYVVIKYTNEEIDMESIIKLKNKLKDKLNS